MWSSSLLSILHNGSLMGLWIAVQIAWWRVYPAAGADATFQADGQIRWQPGFTAQ